MIIERIGLRCASRLQEAEPFELTSALAGSQNTVSIAHLGESGAT
jgi:hypothetical protein